MHGAVWRAARAKAAVVSNAAWHACGVRVRDLPTTLDKVLRALEKRPAW
ncbi:hypothetical protein ACFVDQ_30935 [Streptomyces sp. NPDC057684]